MQYDSSTLSNAVSDIIDVSIQDSKTANIIQDVLTLVANGTIDNMIER